MPSQRGGAPFEDVFAEDVGELEALVAGVTQTTQSTLLLKKRKDMREVDDALDFMKEEFKKRMERCEERQRDFDKSKREMHDQVQKFVKFISENDAKFKRAQAKLAAEKSAREGYEKKEQEERERLNSYVRESEALAHKLQGLLRYQSYLESVIAPGSNDNDFEDIGEVLNRYQTLNTANQDLQQHQADGEAEFDQERTANAHMLEKTQNDILVKNSRIHEKQKQVEQLKKRTAALQSRIETMEQTKKATKTEYGQVVMSIKNLHNRCCSSLVYTKVPPLAADEKSNELLYLTECLTYIASRVNDLAFIAGGDAGAPEGSA